MTNNPKEADAIKENNINNLSNINFLKSTREKEAALLKNENKLNKANIQTSKTFSYLLKNDLKFPVNKSSKKNPSNDQMTIVEAYDGIFFLKNKFRFIIYKSQCR